MEIEEFPTPEIESEDNNTPFGGSSLLDQFRSDLQELEAIQDVLIPVKGYGRTNISIKYRLPDSGKELDMIARKVERQTKDRFQRTLEIAMDTMIHLCIGIYVNPNSELPEPVELDPNRTGSACLFDDTLAEMMSMENPKTVPARSVLKRLFGGQDLAIMEHAGKLNRWLMDTKADLEVEFWQLGG